MLNKKIEQWRDRIEEDFNALYDLTSSLGNQQYIDTIAELRERIHDPFLFVIVGEVKAGKSSFINALLGSEEDICAVAPSPMTDKIQQIQYGEERHVIKVNEYFQRIFINDEVLKDIAVVDTPGTNTIVEHHQEITERFVPVADLIVFVFEAKNPYRQSSWDFYNFIQEEWHKKIIFVLQQKDLMDEKDLAINKDGVRSHAISLGHTEPVIFAVSAKEEQEGKTEESGFRELHSFLSENVTGPKAYVRKLSNYVDTAFNVIHRIDNGIQDRERQLEADVSFRQDITDSLEEHEKLALNQVDLTIDHLTAVYNQICDECVEDLKSGLSFFSMVGKSISSIFSKSSSPQTWIKERLEKFERDLTRGMNAAIAKSHSDITSQIKQMVKTVSLQIQNSETILKHDHELFSYIAEDREKVIEELQETFQQFIESENSFAFENMPEHTKSFLPQVVTGGGLAIIGVIITSMTQLMVLDITGGVLSGIGVIFAGVTVGLKKRKMLNEFREQIQTGKDRLKNELGPALKRYAAGIRLKTENQFSNFDRMVTREKEAVTSLRNRMNTLISSFSDSQKAIARELGP